MKTFKPIRVNPWREIAILMIILMEVSWITPWFRSLTPETYAINSLRVLIVLAIIVFASHFFVRVMDYLQIKKSIRQGLIVIVSILSSIIGIKTLVYTHETTSLSALLNRPIRSFIDIQSIIPVEFVVIVAIMIGIWRGISLAQQPIGPTLVKSHFLLGIVMFIAFIFLITLATGEDPGEFFYLFLFTSLIGVSAARMSVIGMMRGGIENRFNRSWFLGIIFTAMVVVGLSSLLGGLLSEKFGWIGGLFVGLFGSLFILVWLVFSPVISFLISMLGNVFDNSQFIKNLGDSFKNLNNLMLGIGNKISDLVSQTGIGSMLSRWAPIIKTIFLVGIIIAIIGGIVLWVTNKLWKDKERRKISDEEKSKIRDGNLLQSILDLLRQSWIKTLSTFEQLTDLKKRRRIRVAARVRQIYIDLLELCESLGQPRPDAVTPLEFLQKIDRLFPELQPETLLITNAYLDVRYGLLPENKNEIANIEAAWNELQVAGLDRLQKQKHNKKN